MSIMRNESGEVRLAWRIILIVLLYVAAAVLVRLIPIVIITLNMVGDGIPRAEALQSASNYVYDDALYSTLGVGIPSAVLGILMVWLLVSAIEKSRFTLKVVQLDWKRNSAGNMLLGAATACLLSLAYILTGNIFSSQGLSLASQGSDINALGFLRQFLLFLAMAFGEEIVFRGYVQERLVERTGAAWGILIGAVLFVLVHQVAYNLSPVLILTGVLLWTTVGILYHLRRSLYLVIILHGLMNMFINLLNLETGDISSVIVHAVALGAVLLYALVRSRRSLNH